jgi:hypothetical protein
MGYICKLAYNFGLFERHNRIMNDMWTNDQEELKNFCVLHEVPENERSKVAEEFEKGIKEYFRLQSVGTGG